VIKADAGRNIKGFVALLASSVLLSCGGSRAGTGQTAQTAQSAQGDKCPGLAKPAVDRALAEVANHAACSSDADCVAVGIASACFDVCTRAVNKSEVDAVTAALKNADCGSFTAAGCTVVAPPCAPPKPPTCNAGHCE
jgi:hypothetical protein